MPRGKTSMRKTKEILRLALGQGLSQRDIATSVQVGKTTVQEIISRAKERGLCWEQAQSMREHQIVERLYPVLPTPSKRPEPDWSAIRLELSKKGMTLALLWVEYREENETGFSYSRFCEKYRAWEKRNRLVMRQQHKYGEKMFVDFSGMKLDYLDSQTGEIKTAEIFVSVLGASNYTFAYAVGDQSIPNWILCNRKSFEFYKGVPSLVVPDNLKAGVKTPCRYDPEANPSFLQMSEHYGTAIMPTRVYKPRDKAKVEVGVQIVQRWILARLRKHTFTSLEEINAAISPLIDVLNEKKMRLLQSSRKELFEKYERYSLKPLPDAPFEIASWKKAKVNIDYHIEVTSHYYSVPFRFVGEQVEVSFTPHKVEIFHQGDRIACHTRQMKPCCHTTIPEHMPPQHASFLDWTPDRLVQWARETGPFTAELCNQILNSRPHPEQGYRSCLGIMRLGKKYEKERLEAACKRALKTNVSTYRSVKSILQNKLDLVDLPERQEEKSPTEAFLHENIRGANYYS